MRGCRPTGLYLGSTRIGSATPDDDGLRRSHVPLVFLLGGRRSGRSREQVAHLLDHHVHAALRTHTIRLEALDQQPQYRCRRRRHFALEGDGDAYSGRGRVLGVGSGRRNDTRRHSRHLSISRPATTSSPYVTTRTARPRAKRPSSERERASSRTRDGRGQFVDTDGERHVPTDGPRGAARRLQPRRASLSMSWSPSSDNVGSSGYGELS